jgi:hypothetical protein
MGILDSISHTPVKTGIRAVFAGVEGVGKTTLACSAPRPLLVPLEAGAIGVKVSKVPMLEHYEHVMMTLDEVEVQCQQGQFPYQSLVFDSITALERLIHQAVLESDPTYAKGNKKAVTMESALGGYGKAYTYANELFQNFLAKCDILASQYAINIIFTCHSFAAKIVDPTVGEYDCWDILLHSPKNQKTYGKREALTQWADLIGFLHEPLFVTEGKSMNRGVSANQGRVLAVCRTPSYVAKNRFGVVNTITLPKDGGWNFLAAEIYQANGFDCYNRDTIA